MLLLLLTVTKYSGVWLIGLDWLSACASLDVDGGSQVSVVEDVSWQFGVGTEFPIKMYMLCTYIIVLVIPVFEMRWFRIASTARVALHSYMLV